MTSSKLWWGLLAVVLAGAVGAVVACTGRQVAPAPSDPEAATEKKADTADVRQAAPPVAAVPTAPVVAGTTQDESKPDSPRNEPGDARPRAEAPKGIDGLGSSGLGGLGLVGGGKNGGSLLFGHGAGMGSAAPMPMKSMSRMNGYAAAPMEEPRTGEGYRNYGVNPFTTAAEDRLSTFSIDVDTASYTIARRKILEGQMPPKDSVRVEEFLNYFKYDLPAPAKDPFAVHLDAAPSPFDAGRVLLRVALQGRKMTLSERKSAHVVFLVDVSGSMQSPDKLPLAKKALRILVDNLRDGDTVALVTYAGGVREVLPPTGLEKKAEIHAAIESLTAGGSTAMSDGLALAYRQAAKTLSPGSSSRVIILSDGDANVGATGQEEMFKTIAGQVKEGVTLSVCGFGMGNYKDDTMEQLADKGNGNYFYVDSLMQARRVFQEQLGGTLEVIAQDVKLQVEFDPAAVRRYRLVGYENRHIADRDFRNDKVDAGEIGSGHSVTAMYELELAPDADGRSLATVRVRAKKPRGVTADEWAFPMKPAALAKSFTGASSDFRFATAVMGAAEIFRRSPTAAGWSLKQVEEIARGATPGGNAERAEFLHLLDKSQNVVGSVAER